MDLKTIVELLGQVVTAVGVVWYLSARLQRIEDLASGTRRDFDRHARENRADFLRIYDKLDAKADKAANLRPVV